MGNFLDVLLHVDKYLEQLINQFGPAVHLVLFGVIFLETGLVIMPFLPGDSLLFAAGLFSHPDRNGFSFPLLMLGLPIAAILGDSMNFHIGKFLGHRFLFKAKFFKPHWLDKTRAFYEKHGAKTIILGRFVPIVRTVAPFVAGMDAMPFKEYLPKCILGSFIWVWVCVGSGYILGEIPWVRQNFEKVILAIVILSVVAIVLEILRDRKKTKTEKLASEKADLNAES
ncbi:MAG: VTT domain-containing protein [Fimbriimonadaceae bacterium]